MAKQAKGKSAGGTQSLERALSVIFALAEAERPLSVADIAERVAIAPSTAYRLIHALEQQGLAERRQRGLIRLGLRILDLSRVVTHQLQRDLLRSARPIMVELTRRTGEASVLTGRIGMNAICLDSVDSPRTIRMAFESGRLQPLYRGATNKALLAFLPQEAIAAVLAEAKSDFPDLDLEQLRADLALIRGRGYDLTTGEVDPDATGIGVPVMDAFGRTVASIGVAGPRDRMEGRVAEFTELVVAAGKRLSDELAWAGE